MLLFKLFIEKKGDEIHPMETLLESVQTFLINAEIKFEVLNILEEKNRKEAEAVGLDEVPALLFDKIRISGQVNEYFILAIIAQLITTEGNDRVSANFELEKDKLDMIKIASAFMVQQAGVREMTSNYIFIIRENLDQINTEEIEKIANEGTIVFILSKFGDDEASKAVAKLGVNENILLGHILRSNIHMTQVITLRKNRAFFGSYIRAKRTKEGGYKGKWSPLLHDTISELKDFYIPLFMTSTPVHLDGMIPEGETNRLVAKVKDNVEIVKALFF